MGQSLFFIWMGLYGCDWLLFLSKNQQSDDEQDKYRRTPNDSLRPQRFRRRASRPPWQPVPARMILTIASLLRPGLLKWMSPKTNDGIKTAAAVPVCRSSVNGSTPRIKASSIRKFPADKESGIGCFPMPDSLYVQHLFPPAFTGLMLGVVCLLQFAFSLFIERRYEKGIAASLFWVIWFPVVYWMLSLFTTLVAFPKVMLRRKRSRARWVSPDRGIGRLKP